MSIVISGDGKHVRQYGAVFNESSGKSPLLGIVQRPQISLISPVNDMIVIINDYVVRISNIIFPRKSRMLSESKFKNTDFD